MGLLDYSIHPVHCGVSLSTCGSSFVHGCVLLPLAPLDFVSSAHFCQRGLPGDRFFTWQ